MTTQAEPRTWETLTYRCTRPNGEIYYLENSDELWRIKLYKFSEPIVRVRLTEDAAGEYTGWLETGKEDEIVMLAQRHLFKMQFVYGVEESEKKGHGKAVHLRITELEEITA
jgi:hypothetical protein